MVITGSNLGFSMKHTASAEKVTVHSQSVQSVIGLGSTGGYIGRSGKEDSDFLSSLNYFSDGENNTAKDVSQTKELNAPNADNTNTRTKFKILSYLLNLLFFHRGEDMNSLMEKLFSGGGKVAVTNYTYCSYAEEEHLDFNTTGTVKTEDGSEINIDIGFSLSRSFMQECELTETSIQDAISMMDPLVINMDGGAAALCDEKFYFDLDCDGSLDELSRLADGSGFLALDLNENGKIDDGSELFGTKSGDGFKDLRKYDSDGNGWIDEADEVYQRLRVFTIDKDGNSKLINLKDADVGAICLDNIETNFALRSQANESLGMIRKSGIFIRESTKKAGIIQHVDMAM